MPGLRETGQAASDGRMLVGHETQVAVFEAAMAGGRLHHAWLLAGRQGVGKRCFADIMAERLLGEGSDALLAAGSHPDHRVLAPPTEGKGAAQKIIPVDAVREIRPFLHEHPAMGGWRVVIVDPIDAMERAPANAFLKELEEPTGKTIFFLISHAPGRLLPTIRSRCRLLRFGPLADEDMATILRAHAVPEESQQALIRLAAGSPGKALQAHGLDLPGLDRAARAVMAGGDRLAFARQFGAPSALPKFEALLQLVPDLLADCARRGADARLFDLFDEATTLARDAIRLAFDRVQVAFALARLLAEAGGIIASQNRAS